MNRSKGIVRSAFAGLVLMSVAGAQAATSLSDAKSKLATAVTDPAALTAVVRDLSPADQVTFVADINKAVENLAGKPSAKAARYVSANLAALAGADKANMTAIVGKIFATVPVEALPTLVDSFSKSLVDRSALKLTDAQFVKTAEKLMSAIADQTAEADNSAVRGAFAAAMLVQASKGTPADLAKTLAKYLPEGSREVAEKEWLPAAAKGNYEPMLIAADAGKALPKSDVVIRMAGPQFMDVLMANLNNERLEAVVLNPDLNAQPMNGLDNEPPVPMAAEPQGYGNQY